jgi:CheY-like chemotaxis protein
MLSAVALQSEIQRLLSSGASAYLTKPLDVDMFLETVSDILHPTELLSAVLQPSQGSL